MLNTIKKSFIFSSLFFLVFGILTPSVYGRTVIPTQSTEEIVSAYRSYKEYKDTSIKGILVPTVVEVPFGNTYFERADFAVLDVSRGIFLPYYYKKETASNKIYYIVSSQSMVGGEYKMYDNNSNTYTEFDYVESGQQNVVNLIIKSSQPITSSKLTVLLDKNVALPNSIGIKTVTNGREKIVLAEKKMSSQTINFPSNTSKEWKIKLSYGQPLRINELRLVQSNLHMTSSQTLRFLATPGVDYKIYFDPDRYVTVRTGEAGNLRSDEDVLMLQSSNTRSNRSYKIADTDKDGHADIVDNCISTYNPDQKDLNKNGRGDICDDFDKDGIVNDKDNCPDDPNRSQIDTDKDGIGDICDVEESRLTEKHKWIPWAGIVFALLVIIILFFITARSRPDDDVPPIQ